MDSGDALRIAVLVLYTFTLVASGFVAIMRRGRPLGLFAAAVGMEKVMFFAAALFFRDQVSSEVASVTLLFVLVMELLLYAIAYRKETGRLV
jgi:hypothetical protein